MGIKYAFRCNERSDNCSRCCCSSNSRPLELVIRNIISSEQLNSDIAIILIHVNKQFVCGCWCFCRPNMDVRLEDNNALIERVGEPCTCCVRYRNLWFYLKLWIFHYWELLSSWTYFLLFYKTFLWLEVLHNYQQLILEIFSKARKKEIK